jgi:hypothetical protein
MNRVWKILLFSLLVGTVSAVLGVYPLDQVSGQEQKLVYHDQPPSAPLPPVLDPAQFEGDAAAVVAYRLAARVPETLYQAPCYCPCSRREGHQSLHDCFTTKHGALCHICQQEAVLCFLERQKNKSPRQIRKYLAKGKALQIDMDETARRFLAKPGSP